MLTQCPSCQTTFRVTSEILRVAQGQVRCGRCQTQFDALERLIEEGPPGTVESGRFLKPPHSPAPPRAELPAAIEVDEPAEQEAITLEGRHIEITGTYRVPDEGDDSGETHLRREVTEEWVEFDENDDVGASPADAADDAANDADETAADDYGDDPETPEHEPAAVDDYRDLAQFHDAGVSAAAARALPQDPLFAEPRRFRGGRRVLLSENLPDADDGEDFSMLTSSARRLPRAQPTSLLWKLLAAPLVLALIVQIVHHYRADLARHPQVGAPLMNAYHTLHLPLTPDWNLHAYEIKQWGVLSDPAIPGTLKVRASITNRAAFAQPYPLLKLVLEDRWGDQVRAREFEPAEYLDPGTAADRMLGPQQQTNTTVNIVDPGPDAEGFRFDVCLNGRAGLVCAADVPE